MFISEQQRDAEEEKTIFGGERLKYMKRQHLGKLLGAQNDRIGKCRKIL